MIRHHIALEMITSFFGLKLANENVDVNRNLVSPPKNRQSLSQAAKPTQAGVNYV